VKRDILRRIERLERTFQVDDGELEHARKQVIDRCFRMFPEAKELTREMFLLHVRGVPWDDPVYADMRRRLEGMLRAAADSVGGSEPD